MTEPAPVAEAAPAAPAATVLVVRPARDGAAPEILLLRRHARQGFMANVWVFPGGRVDDADRRTADPDQTAAIRETREEAGLTLHGPLTFVAHWVTPVHERKRFDTRFYLTTVDADAVAIPDTTEVTEALWLAAAAALARHAQGELPLAPPTWVILDALAPLPDLAAVLAWAAAQRPEPICPRLELGAGTVRVHLPTASLTLAAGAWTCLPTR